MGAVPLVFLGFLLACLVSPCQAVVLRTGRRSLGKRGGGAPATQTATNPALFKDVWAKEGSRDPKKEVLGLVEHLQSAAKAGGVEQPIMMWGTLLGIERHGGLIPWDDDMDVVMKESDFHKIQSTLEKDPKIGVTPASMGGRYFHKLYYKENKMIEKAPQQAYSWPFLDVFLLHSEGDKVKAGSNLEETYDHGDIYPLKSCTFEGIASSCPNNPHKLLEYSYGKSWATECDSGDHCHRTEAARPGHERVLCSGLGEMAKLKQHGSGAGGSSSAAAAAGAGKLKQKQHQAQQQQQQRHKK